MERSNQEPSDSQDLILNDDRKCVVVDTKLQKIAIVLRSLADLSYIWSIIRDIRDIRDDGGILVFILALMFDGPVVFRSIPIAILAVLPVPQVAILVFFPRLRASRAVNRMRIMNSLILLQYVPRIYPIYRHCKDLNKNKLDNYISDQIERKTWVPGLLNFILYIISSHVFGAFWYFFSIQRQIACWGHACQSGNGCEFCIFDCDDVWHVGVNKFSAKGLAVFLLGHTKSKANNKEYWIVLKMMKIELDIERMSVEYGLPNASRDIHKIVRRQIRREEDLAVKNIFSILPSEVQDIIKRHLLLPKLKEVPTLQGMAHELLDAILEDLERVTYDGGNCIIREGDPLDMMIFISRGRVLTYNTTSTGHRGGGSGLSNTIGPWLPRGHFYGEELISWAWAATSTSFSHWPISNKTLKAHKKVEVFAIRASALLLIVSEHKKYLKTETPRPPLPFNSRIEINEYGN
ncbi:unnamed protein product [Prunus armeniaca]|uniref:Cyclic nucleotide-binding domain-containing protein n=1 Tax=Prunus armeniaca TaxID=36596 RepID=A0A6J5XRR9_PRUAR|nr:unnamed protein product [Prunus armeniaca]